MSDKRITNGLEILLFLHCGKCIEDGLPSDIEAGWTEFGIQVWCKAHQVNIVNVDFQGAKHPADTSRHDIEGPRAIPEPKGHA